MTMEELKKIETINKKLKELEDSKKELINQKKELVRKAYYETVKNVYGEDIPLYSIKELANLFEVGTNFIYNCGLETKTRNENKYRSPAEGFQTFHNGKWVKYGRR